MINEKIELSSSYLEIHITDIVNYPREVLELEELKIIVHLNDYNKFDTNYKYLLDIPKNKHIQLRTNKYTLNNIHFQEIMNNFIIKSIVIEDYQHYINCFSVEEMHNSLLINNQKIIDKMEILTNGINTLSKARELAYTANKILSDYKETDSNFNVIKQKLNYVNSLASKM